MWHLKKKDSDEVFHLNYEKNQLMVGRFNADWTLADDNSISRNHASLIIHPSYVEVLDLGSRYGTFCNDGIEKIEPIEAKTPFQLKDGDRICFGRLNNHWTLNKIAPCTFTSNVNVSQKKELKKIFGQINGKMVNDWSSDCTHLTMARVQITVKLVRALVEGIPIVDLNYWKIFAYNLKRGKNPPNVNDHLPDIEDDIVANESEQFKINFARKQLFAGKTFIFLSKGPYELYRDIIERAGGATKTITEGVSKSFVVKPGVIVVSNSSSSQTQSQSQNQMINAILDFLQSKGKRIISETEIGLSIVYCSTERHCNPDADMFLFGHSEQKSDPARVILAGQTEKSKSELQSAVRDIIEIASPESQKVTSQVIPNEANKIVAPHSEVYDVIETPVVQESDKFTMQVSQSSTQSEQIQNNLKRKAAPLEFIHARKRQKSPTKDIELDAENNSMSFQNLSTQFSRKSRERTKRVRATSSDDENDGNNGDGSLFAFSKKPPKRKRKESSSDEEEIVVLTNPTPTLQVHEPIKIAPIDFRNKSWLSTSRMKSEIKDEGDAEMDELSAEWKKSFKNLFDVKVVSFQLNTTKNFSDSSASTPLNTTTTSTNGSNFTKGKNFKAFVKKINYKIPATIINTSIPTT